MRGKRIRYGFSDLVLDGLWISRRPTAGGRTVWQTVKAWSVDNGTVRVTSDTVRHTTIDASYLFTRYRKPTFEEMEDHQAPKEKYPEQPELPTDLNILGELKVNFALIAQRLDRIDISLRELQTKGGVGSRE